MYSDQIKQQLGNLAIDYLILLDRAFNTKLIELLDGKPTQVGSYEILIKRFEGGELEINYDQLNLHLLLSGNQYSIKGRYNMKVMKDLGDGGARSTNIEINFSDVNIYYNPELNEFVIENNIPVNYVRET
jgi:hypothetical protein